MKIMGKNKLLSRWRKGDILLKIYEHCGKQGYWLRGKTYKWQFINGVEHLLPLSSANFYNEDCGCDATEYRVKEYFGMNGATPCDNDHYINPNKRIIWTNNDYNEWREAMIADMEEGETEDDFDYERYGEYCDVCLYDERANLDIEVDGIIVAFVNLGHAASTAGTGAMTALNAGTSSSVISWEPNSDSHTLIVVNSVAPDYSVTLTPILDENDDPTGLYSPVAYRGVTDIIDPAEDLRSIVNGTLTARNGTTYTNAVTPTIRTLEDNSVYTQFVQLLAGVTKFRVYIHKVIPMQAGLGGGSSNAAFTMKAVNQMLKLNATDDEIIDMAKTFGADIPFFVKCIPARCRGIGEIMEPIEIKNNYSVLIVKPSLGCSTKEVFAIADKKEYKYVDIDSVVKALKEGDDDLLAGVMGNSLEDAASSLVPEIQEIKATLKEAGFKLVLMSGSGSTVFALSTDSSLVKKVAKQLEDKYIVEVTKVIKK